MTKTLEYTTLGPYLRYHREQKGITLEQVSSATKIGVKVIQALESDAYDQLPAKPFVRGFVISIARFIGLDSRKILAEFDGFLELKTQQYKQNQPLTGYAFDKKTAESQQKSLLLITMIVTIIVGAGLFFLLKPNLHHKKSSQLKPLMLPPTAAPITAAVLPDPAPAQPLITVTKTPEVINEPIIKKETPVKEEMPVSPVRVIKTETQNVPQNLPKDPPQNTAGLDLKDPLDSGLNLENTLIRYKMLVSVHKDIWVRYQVDNRPIRKFIVRAGNKLVLRAKEEIQFEASDPEALVISNNNKKIEWDKKTPLHIVLPEKKPLRKLGEHPLLLFVPSKAKKSGT